MDREHSIFINSFFLFFVPLNISRFRYLDKLATIK